MADLNVSKAALAIRVKTSCTGIMTPVNVPLDGSKVNRVFDELVILWKAANTPQLPLHAQSNTWRV